MRLIGLAVVLAVSLFAAPLTVEAQRAENALRSASENVVLTTTKALLLFVSALFPLVNPAAVSPIFLSMTQDYSRRDRRALARRVAVNSLSLLIGSYLMGTYILALFGISLPVVQVGGGLIVISTGWTMLKQDEAEPRVHREAQSSETFPQAFYPLTLPLTVGPGSISVAITLGANARHGYGENLTAVLAALVGSLLIALSIYVFYGFADRLARIVGKTGMTVITRLTSFLLVCIGVQILWNGVSALVATLPGHDGGPR